MVILENIDIDIDKAILQNIDIDKISNRFKFGISNRATTWSPASTTCHNILNSSGEPGGTGLPAPQTVQSPTVIA